MELKHNWWTLEDIHDFIRSGKDLVIDNESKEKIRKCRAYLNENIQTTEAIYGINTGFGSLCNTSISPDSLEELQVNLVRSHACGMGDHLDPEIIKLMLLLKVRGLSFGYSGVSENTVQRLTELYNNDLLPEIFEQGSLGASGDLAPLAHMALCLIGEGKIWSDGQYQTTAEIYNNKGWEALTLQSKEGLAMLNGTQFMSAHASWCLLKGQYLLKWANIIGAMSIDVYDGRQDPFSPEIHEVRAHNGQVKTAGIIREILEGSILFRQTKIHVQDPYSFRCIPQVHGATRDTFEFCRSVVEREINSVTDNPIIFPDAGKIISGGNFHGQPLALSLDYLAIACAEIGSISERRIYKLISGTRGLPPFLTVAPGLNSGFMIPQYTAASIVSQNKQLCTPASVDTVDSSNGQEDHVSMGANAATKAKRVVENLEKILAIELLTAAQGLNFRRPHNSSEMIEKLHSDFREKVSFNEHDRIMHDDMEAARKFIKTYDINGYPGY